MDDYKKDIIKRSKSDFLILYTISEELKNDKEFILELIKSHGKSGQEIKHASERLRDDKDIVLEAVRDNPFSLKYSSERLQNDMEVVLEAIRQDGLAVKYASKSLRNDRSFVLEAVKNSASTLFYASDRLQNDKELLEILEKTYSKDNYSHFFKNLYEERMEVLAKLREKEFMQDSIIESNKKTKKLKF